MIAWWLESSLWPRPSGLDTPLHPHVRYSLSALLSPFSSWNMFCSSLPQGLCTGILLHCLHLIHAHAYLDGNLRLPSSGQLPWGPRPHQVYIRASLYPSWFDHTYHSLQHLLVWWLNIFLLTRWSAQWGQGPCLFYFHMHPQAFYSSWDLLGTQKILLNEYMSWGFNGQ